MARRPRQQLDDVDRELCRALMGDPRVTVRDLAVMVGVTNETVTARLRRLRESNVLATTVVVDSETAGYAAGAVVRIRGSHHAVEVLKERFGSSPFAQFVAVAMGACDFVVAILGVDLAGVRATLNSAMSGVDSARVLAVDVVTGAVIFDLHTFTLPVRSWSLDQLPAPQPPLDELDRALIAQLSVAGHESNREIARRLEVSDATVRARIRRLEQGGLIRLVAGVDPVAAGDRQLFAMLFITVDDDSVVMPMLERDTATTCVQTVGPADVVLQVGAAAVTELSDFVAELAALDGVREVAVAYLTDVIVHQYHLARFT